MAVNLSQWFIFGAKSRGISLTGQMKHKVVVSGLCVGGLG